MKVLITFACLLCCVVADFALPGEQFVHGAPTKPWTGPLANHVLGVPPKETPEVSAARATFNEAYHQVLAVLPQLPPEEIYKVPTTVVQPIHQHLFVPHIPQIVPTLPATVPVQPIHQHLFVPHTPQIVPAPQTVPTLPATVPQTFAEQVPRSALGEVPEVAAAREAHLREYQKVAATLPRLVETNQVPVVHVPVPTTTTQPLALLNYVVPQTVVQDTPEVLKAKAEHAAAVAAALGYHN